MTSFSSLRSKIQFLTASPANPVAGDFYIDSNTNRLYVYASGAWFYAALTTTTSTSTSTTTTSTSTTTTSTSSSTSTSTSTSTTTSTTTTL